VRALHGADAVRDVSAQQRRERRAGLHDGGVHATRGGGARYLGADEAAAHDHDAPVGVELVCEPFRVAEFAQGHDAWCHEARRAHRLASDGDDEPVVGQVRAIRAVDAAGTHVQARGADPEPQVDRRVCVRLRGPQQEALVTDRVAGEQRLGHQRAVVRRRRLGRHHAEVSVVTLTAQLQRAAHRRHRR
jgi:hypothetical protein